MIYFKYHWVYKKKLLAINIQTKKPHTSMSLLYTSKYSTANLFKLIAKLTYFTYAIKKQFLYLNPNEKEIKSKP